MQPPDLNDQRTPLSRGPSGLPRSGKSGKNSGSASVETTGDRSVRALRRVPGAGGEMIDRPTDDVFASVADADNDPASP